MLHCSIRAARGMTTMSDLHKTIDRAGELSRQVSALAERRLRAASERYGKRVQKAAAELAAHPLRNPLDLWRDAMGYAVDAAQRHLLFWDTVRRRGNDWIAHERAGKPPLLHYDYELLADARTFERPCAYALLRIVPPADTVIDDRLRPFIIIDPRAGHGPGIGGFKKDSEVGVALHAGHPVYFVIFFPEPLPGQTLADVVDAEAEFVRIVAERHPASPKPVLVGNCQGGWAVMMLAASRPDIAGPCVVNGAPISYWAGNDGENPLRYIGGLAGGAWVSLFASDLGAGKFDGAHLVQNFENLNPANSLWLKYYHLWANVDTEPERFLEFERWWGGFYLFNDHEIRWIVNNLFVGNKLSAGEARLGPGRFFDLKSIKSPIIVFASMGDNITPPQQAFNWIGDLYSSTEEIKANGQTIVGLLHEDIGHLGIFVSGQVAKREHAQIVELLKHIQQLPPGLYGMDIKETHVAADGTIAYDVMIVERTLEDLRKMQKYDRVDEKPFEAVAALSELTERAYELLARPIVRQATPEWLAKLLREFHPLRVQRWALSDYNPWLAMLSMPAALARSNRQLRSEANALLPAERFGSEAVAAALDLYRDVRDASHEALFYHVYGNMLTLNVADQRREIKRATRFDPRALPVVRQVLDDLESGGPVDGFVRIGLLIAKAGSGRRKLSSMERVRELIAPAHLLDGISEDEFRRLMHEETIIVEFEPLRAKRALPRLLRSGADRRHAHELLDAMERHFKLDDRQLLVLAELRALLPVPAAASKRTARLPSPPTRRAPRGSKKARSARRRSATAA
jgi:pimeloyl-ACP methyl ester carboxylesterase/plasmid stabilization system protein ParE